MHVTEILHFALSTIWSLNTSRVFLLLQWVTCCINACRWGPISALPSPFQKDHGRALGTCCQILWNVAEGRGQRVGVRVTTTLLATRHTHLSIIHASPAHKPAHPHPRARPPCYISNSRQIVSHERVFTNTSSSSVIILHVLLSSVLMQNACP